MAIFKHFLLLLLVPWMASCTSLRTVDQIRLTRAESQVNPYSRRARAVTPAPTEVKAAPVETPAVEEAPPAAETAEAEETASDSEIAKEDVVESLIEIPQEMNGLVQKWITYFTVRDRERFQRFLDNGQRYRDVIENVLEQNDLPSELYYLAMIESGFQPHATSTASASGVWQFISATGRRYGLAVNSDVDERRDPIRSTEAAARYLRDLHNVFGSWHLAMAAYNAGEMRIVRAVFNGKTRNFWELVSKRSLPSETANYVPKFLAALMIGRNLEHYGFKEPKTERYPDLQAVEVPSPVHLSDVAKMAGLSTSKLKDFNPHIKHGRTPRNSKTYEVWIPTQHVARVESRRKSLKVLSRTVQVAATAKSNTSHVVRRGENLSTIARKYKVTVSYLKRTNKLRSSRILVGQRLRVKAKSFHSDVVAYRVRRGDNLTLLAKRFGTTVHRIKSRNALKRSTIYVGQVLKVDTRM